MAARHEMKMVKLHATGASEWHCETCGRLIVMQPTPFKRITLNQGDENALHFGGEIALNVTASVTPAGSSNKDQQRPH